MRNHFIASAALALTLAGATPALAGTASTSAASDASGRIGVGVTAGSLGIGPEVDYAITRNLTVRGNLTFLNFSHDYSTGDIDFDGSARLGSGGVMLDYHPFKSGFFVSAGGRINKNKVRVTATPSSNVTIGGNEYTPEQVGTLKGFADFRTLAPTLTTGFRGHLGHGVRFGIEAGAMFMGSARVRDLTFTGTGVSSDDLAEEQQKLRDEIDDYKIYPIVQISAGYRF